MTDTPTETLANLLGEARATGLAVAVADVPTEAHPPNRAAAEKVDDRVAELVAAAGGGQPVGWKIGCTSEAAQEILGTDGPFPGRVYDLHHSSADFDATTLSGDALLEGEFAFVLGTTLSADGPTPTRDQVVEAVATVHAAIEVVGGRYDSFVGCPVNLIIADAGANRALVIGEGSSIGSEVEPGSLSGRAATMTVDGEVTGSGTGADVLGDPIDALVWLVQNLHDRGIDLGAGEVVTTGTATQVTPLHPGSSATVTIEGLASATVTRSSP